MFSYQEFPEQIKNAAQKLTDQFGFEFMDQIEDHCLHYQNEKWRISFVCDHGAIEIYIANLVDNSNYYLPDLLKFYFPESEKNQNFPNYFWGSKKAVDYQIGVLYEFFPKLDSNYESRKKNFHLHKEYEKKLFIYMMEEGSKELKNRFMENHPKWKELALNEIKLKKSNKREEKS